MRFRLILASLLIIVSLNLVSFNILYALTVKEEKELGKEVLTQVERSSAVVADPYIKDYVSKLGQKMAKSSNARLFDFRFMVIKDKSYNAFAVPGGYIFVHTGLIAAMEHESELAGILGHEIAHVNLRHIAQQVEDSKKVSAATLAGLAAGIMLGMNGADPDAVMGVIAGTQAAGQSAMLSYSRNHEREADNRGLKYINNAGYSPKGLLEILKKIRAKEFQSTSEAPVYLRTHPGTEERIEKITAYISQNKDNIKDDEPELPFSKFNKVRVKIIAFYQDKNTALKQLEEIEKDPLKKGLAYYGKGLLSMRDGEYDKSIDYFSKALKFNALDTEMLFDYGRALFLKGEYLEALKKFEAVNDFSSKFPNTEVLMGRSYLELKMYKKAQDAFLNVTKKNPDYANGFYFLGIAYEKNGKKGDAHLSLGIYNEMMLDFKVSLFHYKKAVALLDGEKKEDAKKRLDRLMKKKKNKDKDKEGKKE